jgi:hypothetical protein
MILLVVIVAIVEKILCVASANVKSVFFYNQLSKFCQVGRKFEIVNFINHVWIIDL